MKYIYISILLILVNVSNIYGQKLIIESKSNSKMVSKEMINGEATACVIVQSALKLSFSTNMGDIPSSDLSSKTENGLYVSTIYFHPTDFDNRRTLIVSCNGYVSERILLTLTAKQKYMYGVYDASSINGSQMSSSSSSVDKKTPSNSQVEPALSFSEKISAALSNSTESSSNSDILETYANAHAEIPIGLPEKIFGETEYKEMGAPVNLIIPYGYTKVEGIWSYSKNNAISSPVQSIVIPSSVIEIGDKAFFLCHKLKSIKIPNSVKSIGTEAFFDCMSLSSIYIPNSVTSIGNYAFRKCENLSAITIPNTVSIIEDYTFVSCHNLSKVDGMESVKIIGKGAFGGCENLVSITIPETVEAIGENAFWGCDALWRITIPNDITSIGDGAFKNCRSLEKIIGGEYFTFEEGILYDKDKTKIITCLQNVVRGNITVPDNVKIIGNYAFQYCSNLVSITIPNTVTDIGDYAFDNCPKLSSIIVSKSSPMYKKLKKQYGDKLNKII